MTSIFNSSKKKSSSLCVYLSNDTSFSLWWAFSLLRIKETLDINKRGFQIKEEVLTLHHELWGLLQLNPGAQEKYLISELSWVDAWLLVMPVFPLMCLPLLHFWCLVSSIFKQNERAYILGNWLHSRYW